MLVKGMKYWETAYEKAPALVISRKKPSSCPRLETIFEEGPELNPVVVEKILFFVLIPLSLSVLSYVVLCR
ncbi:hypothetical protein E1A91_D10G049500v1 [Gossypium mustelinum]|uniref:Uncharacterized protein n=1 Tax=Gossypium mustelinum TaxID=34275 RepID=A0A5D2T4N7_GOSMU|nr:hypothetical protein E1A91_D10G049500v1 [Gossypium mustelinum]